jgi:hypothetical protein
MKAHLSFQWVPKDPDLGVILPQSNLPKSLGLHLNLGLTTEALLNFMAAILQDYPEENLSSAYLELILAEIRRVFCETLAGGTHLPDPTDLPS